MKSWIVRGIETLEWFVGVLFLLLFLLNMLRISLRYCFGIAWLWEPDFSRLLFVWIVFIGATVLYAAKGHLMVDYFLNQMSSKAREHMHLIIDAVTTIFLAVLLVKGIEVTRVRMGIPFDTWDLPTGYAYVAVPICSGVMMIVTLLRMAEYLSARRGK
jgi:TRAP-type C4-dicarboxylate transport system permease small subunit